MEYDVMAFGETMLRLTPPMYTRLEEASLLRVYVAGSESNVLACLARLGLACAWLSAVPQNPTGRHVVGELRKHGVDTRHVVWADAATRLGIFYAEESEPPLGLQVSYDRANSAFALSTPDRYDLTVVARAKLLHLSGITPALSLEARAVFDRALQEATNANLRVSFDVNYRAKLWEPAAAVSTIAEACRVADLVFCTRDDASLLWGFQGEPREILEQMAQRFAKDGQTIVLTLGSEGAAQLAGGVYEEAASFPSQGSMRFGSGDAFAAGYLYAYLDGPYFHQLHKENSISPLAFGNALAALKRCIAGDIASVTPEEVLKLLRGADRQRWR